MFTVGSFVEFTWWSNYYAPSVYSDGNYNTTWNKLNPGDKGVIIGIAIGSIANEIKYSVLFISVPGIPLSIHNSMLKLA